MRKNIANLKAKFVLFSKYATPLNYQLQSKAIIDKNDGSALFYKQTAQAIFRESLDIYTTVLLKTMMFLSFVSLMIFGLKIF